MRFLVLGGSGFIGRYLVDTLLAQGHYVRVFGRSKLEDNTTWQRPNLKYIAGDLVNEVDIANVVKDIDICFHLVSTTVPQSSNDNPIYDVETNLVGSIHLLQQAVENNIKKIIFISSGGTVYGIPEYLPIDENHPANPICSYGIVKLTIEKYMELYSRLHGLKYVILRLSNPYGARHRLSASQGVIPVFLGKILRNQELVIWGDGSVVRDYIHVDDVVAALMASIQYNGKEHVMNIGSGEGVSLNQLIDIMERETGLSAKRVYTEAREFDVPVCVLSSELARLELKWKPKISLNKGVGQVANSLKRKVLGSL